MKPASDFRLFRCWRSAATVAAISGFIEKK
jgi:hypothetical protein